MTEDTAKASMDCTSPSRRSVCFVTQQVNFGGTETHTLALISALIEHGCQIELVANRYGGYDRHIENHPHRHRITLIHTDLDGILFGEHSDRAGWRHVFRSLNSSVLVLVKGNNNYGQLGFLKECRRAFTKVVFIEHLEPVARPTQGKRWLGILPGLGLWWQERRLRSWLGSRYADQVVAVSDRVAQRLMTDMWYPPKKLQVVRNGVAAQDFPRDIAAGLRFRRAFGIDNGTFVFGMLARLSHEKGIDVALQALKIVAAQHPDKDFCLLVAGDGDLKDALLTLASTLGIAHRTQFLGFVEKPGEFLSAIDVILFSSRLEGLPLGLLQGMAAGCIPIVTRISGMPEAVGPVGWVVSADDPEELANAMGAAMALNAGELQALGSSAARRVAEDFDIRDSNRRLVELCAP